MKLIRVMNVRITVWEQIVLGLQNLILIGKIKIIIHVGGILPCSLTLIVNEQSDSELYGAFRQLCSDAWTMTRTK